MKKRGIAVKKINWKVLLLSFIAVYATAAFGSSFTKKGVNSFWYLTVKPSITPPDWVFPIAWNIIFFLIFLALYFFLAESFNKKFHSKIEILFAVNLMLNFLWSYFYFELRNPIFAFFDLLALLFTIVMIICGSWKKNRKVSILLIPYLIWILFAGVLNFLSIFKAV
jgi:translocator protein